MQIVTLSTDIGAHDYITGAVKGQLLTASAELNIVDIIHTLSSSNYPQTAYICNNAFKYFPAGTLHILIVNLFENSPQRILIAEYKRQYIICPDNGILTMITGTLPANVRSVALPGEGAVNTLSYSKAVADIVAQSYYTVPSEIGERAIDIEEKYPLRATVGADWIEGQIIFIDHFENVIVNIMYEEFEEQRKGRSFKIAFRRNAIINVLSNNYASVNPGETLAWFNAAGLLELAINKGNMAGLFGLRSYSSEVGTQGPMQNQYFYQTVRIYFE